MKRTLPSLSLILILLLGLAAPASAASAGHLTPKYTYQGEFTDVRRGDWYYNNVKTLYELGLSNGKGSPNRFAPADNITLAESVPRPPE